MSGQSIFGDVPNEGQEGAERREGLSRRFFIFGGAAVVSGFAFWGLRPNKVAPAKTLAANKGPRSATVVRFAPALSAPVVANNQRRPRWGVLGGGEYALWAAFGHPSHPPAQTLAANEGPRSVTVVRFSPDGQAIGETTGPRIVHTDEEWRRRLGADAYWVLRHADTERPFTGALLHEERRGVFTCAGCDLALFSSMTKFDSGTGWPSFWQPIAPENIVESPDGSLMVVRTAVSCRLCDGHLGHVFTDGPKPTGLRYCMNSVALKFAAA
jgi:peptide-methionine (R)-S-oxide reductase